MRIGISFQVSPEDRERLERLVADRNTPQKHAHRARIVLLSAAGVGTMEIMARTGQSKPTVWRWQARLAEAGVDGLLRDKTRPPGKAPLAEATVRQVGGKDDDRAADRRHAMELAGDGQGGWHHAQQCPEDLEGAWVEAASEAQLEASNDPDFEAKLVDVVGLYLDPPDRALVLSVDEKSQIQALDRTQPGLPLKKGRAGTLTHDYKRHISRPPPRPG